MDLNIKYILDITKAVLLDKKQVETPKNIDWNKIYSLCVYHGIASIFTHAVKMGICKDVSDDIKTIFNKLWYKEIIIDENQKKAAEELFECFDKNQIDYLPLKGIELKSLYPYSDMRRMGDIDILIKNNQYDKIKNVMQNSGYEFVLESNHEYIFKKPPFVTIELHKFLIPTYNDDMHCYYRDGWSFAQRVGESNCFLLTNEDNYIYIMTHFAKHYRDGGAGIKYLIDLYLLKKHCNNMDFEYINNQFKRLNIDKFAKNIDFLLKVWFDNEKTTPLIEDMTNYIVLSGEYGTGGNKAIVKSIRENKDKSFEKIQSKKYLNVIFPHYSTLKNKYRILKKLPVLLPIFYIWRIVSNVFKFENIKRFKNNADFITTENMKFYYSHIKEVGLDIYNGRKNK